MAEAEVELAEGRQASAIERYLDVVAPYRAPLRRSRRSSPRRSFSVNRAAARRRRLLDATSGYRAAAFTEDVRRLQRALEQRPRPRPRRTGAPRRPRRPSRRK